MNPIGSYHASSRRPDGLELRSNAAQ
jgi:hypothetical protein